MLPFRFARLRDAYMANPAAWGKVRPFSAYNADRHLGRDKNAPGLDKLRTKEFLGDLGIRVARTLHVLDSPDHITSDLIPDRCVVKPFTGTSSGGVMLLVRDGDGYSDLMKRRPIDLEQVRAYVAQSQEKYRKQFGSCSPSVIIEEAIVDEEGPDLAPFDYKLWVFNGTIAFIDQIDRNGPQRKHAWYLGDFQPIDIEDVAHPEIKWAERGEHRLPGCREELLHVASVASRALKTPFIRVDAFASPDGAFVGELTPAPGAVHVGGFRLLPWFDALLGREWERAAAELGER